MFNEDLFLTNETGKRLYHKYAEGMPIIDYHCHLPIKEIYEDKEFEDIGEMWLSGDHYKWRAMRTFGIEERLITGDASYKEKYLAFANIIPKLVGNPIYIWCALELKRYFGIDEPLCAENAEKIYKETKAIIQKEHMSPSWCMAHNKVVVSSTTEDPIDSLDYHKKLMDDPNFSTRILSAYRPDKAYYCEKADFAPYLPKLAEVSGKPVNSFASMMDALEARLQEFKKIGTMISDNGLASLPWAPATEAEVEAVYQKAAAGQPLTQLEIDQYKTAFMLACGRMYYRNGFVMQLHIGTLKNANSKMFEKLGADTGYDCTDDNTPVGNVRNLLDALNSEGNLPKTLLYPLNANGIEPYAILAAAFCGDGVKAKVQLAAAWWFNDQAYGIARQFEACGNLYPVSLSVGMLTDSRSFLSYPRHELYRRVFCNYLGELVERGEYFSGEEELGKIVKAVSYENAQEFFGL